MSKTLFKVVNDTVCATHVGHLTLIKDLPAAFDTINNEIILLESWKTFGISFPLLILQEPYASDDLQYDDNRVKLSAKVHFLSNTVDTKWTRAHLTSIPVHLNADSEGARKLYVHSAPAGGASSRRMGIDPNKLRKRSNLFLPVKASKAQVC